MNGLKHGRPFRQAPKPLIPPGRIIVHVLVGEEAQDFGIHNDLICHYSPTFKAAFNSGFEEAQTGVMKLPQTEVDIFELFYDWLYTQRLTRDKKGDKMSPKLECLQFMKLYIFADMAGTPSLQNQCIDMLNKLRQFPVSAMQYAWENTMQSSPLRRYLVDVLVAVFMTAPSSESCKHCLETFSEEIFKDVIIAMREHLVKSLASGNEKYVLPRLSDDMTKYYVEEEAGKSSF